MRGTVEFAGLVLVVAGLAMAWLPLGVIAAGVLLVAAANVGDS